MTKMALDRDGHDDEASSCAEEVCEVFHQLVVKTAAHRTWSMLSWHLPPEQWNGVLSSNPEEAQAAFKVMQTDAAIVGKAMDLFQSNEHAEHKATASPVLMCFYLLCYDCGCCRAWKQSLTTYGVIA